MIILNNQKGTLKVNFKCKDGDNSYTIFATTERLRCFECDDVGHERLSCPHGAVQTGSSGDDSDGIRQQRRRDRQQEDTGETETAAGLTDPQSNDTPQSELTKGPS